MLHHRGISKGIELVPVLKFLIRRDRNAISTGVAYCCLSVGWKHALGNARAINVLEEPHCAVRVDVQLMCEDWCTKELMGTWINGGFPRNGHESEVLVVGDAWWWW